jgi:arylsulfatase A-like enzyme
MRIIVLSIEGLQPAFLGPYGNEWVETPTFDRWAAAGVVFDQHFADVPEVSAANRSWPSGLHSGVSRNKAPDLIRQLIQAGLSVLRIGPSADGFGTSGDRWIPAVEHKDPLSLAVTRRRVRAALKKLEQRESSLIWVELDALLPPWNVATEFWDQYSQQSTHDDDDFQVTEPWFEQLPHQIDASDNETWVRIQSTYAAAVSQLDAALGELMADAATQYAEETIWIITSPFGLPLGVHGAVGLPSSLHLELVHLPLIIAWPNGDHAGRRVHALTQPMDLAPTIAGLFGVPWQTDCSLVSGQSVLRLVESRSARIRSHAISIDSRGGYSVRSPNWCLLHQAEHPDKLFVKPDDRWEVNDLAQHNPGICDELQAVYSQHFIRAAK